MDHVKSLKCLICGREYRPDQVEYVCPLHGEEGILDVQYDYGLIGRRISPKTLAEDRNYTIWRYKPLLPIAPDSPVTPLATGWTPLYRADRLAAGLGLRHVWVKDDGRQPSASFKDRASAIAVVKGRERKARIITTASTGNAAAALAVQCASVEQANVIFVPESAPPAKIAQLLVFGSTVILVRGTYDDAFELCGQAAKEFGWYNRNTGYNPYMTEGKKTASLEICEQLGWDADAVDLFALHQVSELHTQELARAVGFDLSKAFLIYPELGNVGPASVPIVLSKALEAERIAPGDRIVLGGIGSGLNCTVAGIVW